MSKATTMRASQPFTYRNTNTYHWGTDGSRWELVIGRMYLEQMPAGAKWCWFLQVMGAPPPKSGTADTLDEAKAEIAAAYERYRKNSTE